jgi:nucleotide-binding universal stress UspA family protein
MTLTLPDRPAKHFIDKVLLPSWDVSEAVGYDPSAAPGEEAFLPVATTLDNVGAGYPSLVVQYSNETTGGESTYDYLTPDGPGQNRQGTLLAIARAEAEAGGYTGDSGSYAGEPAEDVAVKLIEAVENVCQDNATGGSSAFKSIGSQRGPEAPDDTDVSPPVRIANTQIDYSWLRRP